MVLPEPCTRCGRLVYPGDTVTIPGAEYRALLARPAPAAPFLRPPSRSPIARDPQLAAFITDCARPGTMILRDIRAACITRFGTSRTPSLSALHRFIAAERKRHGIVT